jgi:hypothetical protein
MAPTLVDVIDLNEEEWLHRTLNWFCTNDARLKQFCRAHEIGEDEKIIVIGRTGRVRELINRGDFIEVILISFRPTLSWQIMVMSHHEQKSKGDHRAQFKSMREGLEDRKKRWESRKRKIAARLRRERGK